MIPDLKLQQQQLFPHQRKLKAQKRQPGLATSSPGRLGAD